MSILDVYGHLRERLFDGWHVAYAALNMLLYIGFQQLYIVFEIDSRWTLRKKLYY